MTQKVNSFLRKFVYLLRYYKNILKKKISISFVTIACLMLTAIYIIPHHHHDGMFCLIMEQCEEDEHIHTHHNNDHQVPDNTCIAKTYYIIPRTHNHVKCNDAFCSNLTHDNVFTLLFFVEDCLLRLNADYSEIKPEYGEYIQYYNSATASQSHGLRAPPFVG